MIERTIGFKASDGTVHETIDGAQKAELVPLFEGERETAEQLFCPIDIARMVVSHSAMILNILTTGPKSRPKARAVNGARRTRATKPRVAAATTAATQTEAA